MFLSYCKQGGESQMREVNYAVTGHRGGSRSSQCEAGERTLNRTSGVDSGALLIVEGTSYISQQIKFAIGKANGQTFIRRWLQFLLKRL